ncbi:DNA polymerase III subunit delta' [Ottowia sp.]|uniref:DNA polymerase III subunit delta' n=1 Tax=Ottowia sp. TaxID=1898956 RepID=UPI003A836674
MTAATSRAPVAPWISAQLQALLAQRGHAWLLQGPSGLGQFELALSLVRAWLCDSPIGLPPGALAKAANETEPRAAESVGAAGFAAGPSQGETAPLGGSAPRAAGSVGALFGACGQCPSCHAIDVHTHTDLAVLMPETELLARGWPLPDKAQADIDDKKRKPSKDIRVDAMRDAIEFAQRTSGRGRGKAVLVYPAERMNPVTANALLKTLEEPPGDVRFVLATDAAHLLLPTIRSRCLSHTMVWPDEIQSLAWLADQGVPADEAPALLHAAGARPAEALALAAHKGSAQSWAKLPRALHAGDAAALQGVPLPEAVARLQKLCHDLMALEVGGAPRYFAAADLPQRPLSPMALARWWAQLTQAARTAEHPLNAGLATEFLVSSARQALNSKA